MDGVGLAGLPLDGGLPERAFVHWRRQVDERSLRARGRWWTATTVAHAVPFVAGAAFLLAVRPILAAVSVVLLIHAWAIPELYAARGAGVLRPRRASGAAAEQRSLLLLGDLVDESNRRLHAASGLVVERGTLGSWVVGEAGAVLVRPGGRRVYCYCVRATDEDLPAADRVAHLLLALRCSERDFATVANLAFSGARWRLRRRLMPLQRLALEAARSSSA
jgi:hypothetical protein